ncbi:MAG: CapA family protein [Candidatus Eremiobacterota bacterium]
MEVKKIRVFSILFLILILCIFKISSNEKTFTMTFVGDILLDKNYLPDEVYPFKYVEEILQKSDITAGNLECPVSMRGYPNPAKNPASVAAGREYIFRASPKMAESLSRAGFDVLSLANNHSMDYGTQALLDTVDFIHSFNGGATGAGKNISDARCPYYIQIQDTLVAFLAYSEIVPYSYGATEYSPGIAVASMDYNRDYFRKDIKKAKENADIVVVYFHWGEEKKFHGDRRQKELARQSVDMGADLVIGVHPHVLQGIEKYKNSLIAYSLGNFVFNPSDEASKETIILQCKFENEKLSHINLIPVYIQSGKPVPATGGRKNKIMERIRNLSAELGFNLKI